MNSEMKSLASGWRGMAASVPGNGHLRRELPCQDASAYIDFGHPALIALDGRGSSPLSQEGSAEGVSLFCSTLAIVEPLMRQVLDTHEPSELAVRQLGEIIHRALFQAKVNCARRHDGSAEVGLFDFTASIVVVGCCHVACFQVGDGVIIVREHGKVRIVFKPDKGDAVNMTRFISEKDDGFRMELLSSDDIDGVAVMTDGVEHRVLDLKTMTPGPLFDALFNEISRGMFSRADLLLFLTDNSLWARGDDIRDDDDRTLGIMIPTEGL